MTFTEIHKQCEDWGILREDGMCCVAKQYPCNGYKCPSVHVYRGTRPAALLDHYGLEEQYKDEMDESV
jgi:hypothetical protein